MVIKTLSTVQFYYKYKTSNPITLKIRIKNWPWCTLVIQVLREENVGRPWIQGQLQGKMAGVEVGKPVGDSQKLAKR